MTLPEAPDVTKDLAVLTLAASMAASAVAAQCITSPQLAPAILHSLPAYTTRIKIASTLINSFYFNK
jgi:hypothetical protein